MLDNPRRSPTKWLGPLVLLLSLQLPSGWALAQHVNVLVNEAQKPDSIAAAERLTRLARVQAQIDDGLGSVPSVPRIEGAGNLVVQVGRLTVAQPLKRVGEVLSDLETYSSRIVLGDRGNTSRLVAAKGDNHEGTLALTIEFGSPFNFVNSYPMFITFRKMGDRRLVMLGTFASSTSILKRVELDVELVEHAVGGRVYTIVTYRAGIELGWKSILVSEQLLRDELFPILASLLSSLTSLSEGPTASVEDTGTPRESTAQLVLLLAGQMGREAGEGAFRSAAYHDTSVIELRSVALS